MLIHSDDEEAVVGNADDAVIDALLLIVEFDEVVPSIFALLFVLLVLLLLLDRPKSCCIANGDLWGTWVLEVVIRWLGSDKAVCDWPLDTRCDVPEIDSNGRVSARCNEELEFNTIFMASMADSQDMNAPEDDTLNGLHNNCW